ncbi:MAG: PepSY-like domain-containing protein [Rhizobacter sp.]|nr:PepSY-like domain-containing protein [Chlorobiales bacterium]
MMTARSAALLFFLLAFVLVPAASSTFAQEPRKSAKKISKPKEVAKETAEETVLPAVVQAAFEKAYNSASIKSVSMKHEDGDDFYKVISTDGAETREILYKANGEPVEITETISLLSLPEVVKESVSDQYPKSELIRARKITRSAPTEYEVSLRSGDENVTIVLDAKGVVIRFIEALPTGVQTAFEKSYPNAVLVSFERKDEKGREYYRVLSAEGDIDRDLLYTADGEVVRVAESYPLINLPEAVKQAIGEKYADGKMGKAKKATSTEYEIVVDNNGDSSLVILDPNGKFSLGDAPTTLPAAVVAPASAPTVALAPLPPAPEVKDDSAATKRVIIIRHYAPYYNPRPVFGWPFGGFARFGFGWGAPVFAPRPFVYGSPGYGSPRIGFRRR